LDIISDISIGANVNKMETKSQREKIGGNWLGQALESIVTQFIC